MATSGNDRVVVAVAVRKCSSICSRRSMRSSSSNSSEKPAGNPRLCAWVATFARLVVALSLFALVLFALLRCVIPQIYLRFYVCTIYLFFFFCYCICCLPAASLCTQLVRVELRPATTPVFTSLRVCLSVCVLLLLPAFLLADYSYNILHTVASYNLKLYDRINCCAVACVCMCVCICVFSTMIQLKDMRHALFITKYLWRRKPLTIQTIELC